MSMNRVEVWDGWRGMAIILLLCGHFFEESFFWIEIGRMGVDAFFVLSGMLMSTILFKNRMNLRDFYIRRFSRIVPAFFLFVLVSFSFAKIINLDFVALEVVTNLTFLRTYIPLEPHIWDTGVPVHHLWSLNVEEHAYVIMSILTLFIFRNTNAAFVLITLGLISICICFYYFKNLQIAPTEYRIRTESAVSFVFLSAGYNLLKKDLNNNIFHFLLPVLSLIGAIICYLKIMPAMLSFAVSPILLAFTINHLHESNKILQGLLELKIIRLMGIWSFSIYLWQQPFYKFIDKIPGANYISLLIAITIGIISFYFYEQPIRSRINKRWTKRV